MSNIFRLNAIWPNASWQNAFWQNACCQNACWQNASWQNASGQNASWQNASGQNSNWQNASQSCGFTVDQIPDGKMLVGEVFFDQKTYYHFFKLTHPPTYKHQLSSIARAGANVIKRFFIWRK
jgi:hypothetical protein